MSGLVLSLPSASQNSAGEKKSVSVPAGDPVSWVRAATENELRIVEEDGTFPFRCLVHKIDNKGETLRDTLETRDGPVARLLMKDGRPLTSTEDAEERARLNDLLASPSTFARHHRKNTSAREYSSDLMRLMPSAMIYSYAPGQPQPAGATSAQVVIDFTPDPKFQPPNMVSQLLTGIEGRLWIDARAHVVTRAEAHVIKAVNFGWGMLAHVYPGGTVVFEQTPLGDGHWVYAFVDEHLKIREVMVKTVNENTTMKAMKIQRPAELLPYQDAIHMLLEAPLAVR